MTYARAGVDVSQVRKSHEALARRLESTFRTRKGRVGHPIFPKNFVIRNRTMALISDASIIVEAGERSGSLHQGWEALRLGRPLLIWKDIVRNNSLKWPKKMLEYGAVELMAPEEVLEVLPSSNSILQVVAS